MIKFIKLNEFFYKIDTTYEINVKLNKLFSIRSPGFMFNPLYRRGMWNGYKELYNKDYCFHGLIPFIIKFAEKNGIQTIGYNQPIIKSNIDDFLNNLKISNRDKKNDTINQIEYRPYQRDAIKLALSKEKNIIVSPTSSGKSLIIYSVCQYILKELKENENILIVVPTVTLVEQMYDDFRDYSYLNGFDVKENCCRVHAGLTLDLSKKIIISTRSSLANKEKSFFEHFRCVIIDECQGAQAWNYSGNKRAKEFHKILFSSINAKYILGFTGTFPDEVLYRTTLQALFGGYDEVTNYETLLENDWISNFQINAIELNYQSGLPNYKRDYRSELESIRTSGYRRNFLKKLLLKNKNNQLLLFVAVEKHSRIIIEDLQNDERFKDYEIYLLDGSSSVEEKNKIKDKIEKQNNIILLATYKLLGAGWSVNNLHNIIFVDPLKSKQTVIQAIGRGLRKLDDTKVCQIWDIIDKFEWKNTLYKHWLERENHYKQYNLDYKYIKISKE